MRTYSEDNGSDIVVKASGANGLLVSLGGTSLLGKDETGTNPHGRSAKHQARRNGLAAVDTASSNDLDGLAGQRAGLTLDKPGDLGDEDGGWDISGVTATLTSLGADNISAAVEGLLNVLGVANHVHAEDIGLVEAVDDVLWWDTDGGHKEFGTALDDNGDKLIEFSLGIIIASTGY